MSRVDTIVTDVQAKGNATDRTGALIGHIKFWVAEAFAGHRIPTDADARLAEIFPALEASAGAIADAITGNIPVEAESEQVEEPTPAEETGAATEEPVSTEPSEA